MDLQKLYAGSFIDWEAVAASWNKRTIPSRLLLFAARRYLEEETGAPDSGRTEMLSSAPLPEEIKAAFASPPEPNASASRRWGAFVDAAVAAGDGLLRGETAAPTRAASRTRTGRRGGRTFHREGEMVSSQARLPSRNRPSRRFRLSADLRFQVSGIRKCLGVSFRATCERGAEFACAFNGSDSPRTL